MATVKVTLDTRSSSQTKDNKFPLVLRLGHQRKTRDISFGVNLLPEQFNASTFEITGIQNRVRNSKRVQKTYGDIDLWLDENKADIKLWTIIQLKDTIEKKFFGKQSQITVLGHASDLLRGYYLDERYSTVSSYEDALKLLVKYRMKLAKKDDKILIKTLFNSGVEQDDEVFFNVLEKYQDFDMPIKAFNSVFVKDFRNYLSSRTKSKNSMGIYLRSLNVILNDAERVYDDLKGHKPLDGIKKASTNNLPIVLTIDEIISIRNLAIDKDDVAYVMREYFFFMLNNMGMNFMDLAIAKVHQFDGKRFTYVRSKTKRKGQYFSIEQNDENMTIIKKYMKGKKQDDYLFPIIPEGILKSRIFKVKQNESRRFITAMNRVAKNLDINKRIGTYTARDTWTNIGAELNIDVEELSSGLGHNSVEITKKHYLKSIKTKILDDVNTQITQSFAPN